MLTITLTGVDSQTGDTYGTCYNDAGPDGKYADFKWNSNGGHDLKKFYRCIPEGGEHVAERRKDGAGYLHGLRRHGPYGDFLQRAHDIDLRAERKVLLCQIMNQGLEFPVAGTPMPGWSDYSDFDKYVQNPQRFIVKMKKRQQ